MMFHIMPARMLPARIESILNAVTRVRGGQSLTVKWFQRLMGLMAAASNVIPLGLLYMRPLQWWLKIRGVFLKGNLFCMIKVTRRCLRAFGMWRQPRFLSQGAGSYLLPCNASDGDAPHRLGSSHGWPPCLLSPSHVAHQLARDFGHVSSTETLLPRPKRFAMCWCAPTTQQWSLT